MDEPVSTPETTWADALRRERAGDASGYEVFLREYSAVLRRVVRRHLAIAGLASSDTEDVIQEVLIAIHSRRDQWDSSRPLLPWLAAIGRYKIIDALRRRNTELRIRSHLTDAQWLALFQDECTPPSEDAAQIERMVSDLPPTEQTVIRKMGMEGLSPRQTAHTTGMKEGTVRVAFHRGLARLLKRTQNGENR